MSTYGDTTVPTPPKMADRIDLDLIGNNFVVIPRKVRHEYNPFLIRVLAYNPLIRSTSVTVAEVPPKQTQLLQSLVVNLELSEEEKTGILEAIAKETEALRNTLLLKYLPTLIALPTAVDQANDALKQVLPDLKFNDMEETFALNAAMDMMRKDFALDVVKRLSVDERLHTLLLDTWKPRHD